MKKQVKHFSVRQCAKVVAVMYFVMSLPIVVLFMLPALLARSDISILAILLFPIFYGVFTYLGAALSTWVYNRVAARVGGLEFTTADVANHAPVAGGEGAPASAP